MQLLTTTAKPFLKWAGGKTQLLDKLVEYFPIELKFGKIKEYIEPFVGGGAVFFHIAQTYDVNELLIWDVNEELILAYKTIRKDVDTVIKQLREMAGQYLRLSPKKQSDYFYQVRSELNQNRPHINFTRFDESWIERTAQIIFLNRTCYNGLFRVNSKGDFNAPFGSYKNPQICSEQNLRAVSEILQRTKIYLGDFTDCEPYVNNETFVYFDPPYRPISKTASFTSYSRYDFDDTAQLRLASFFCKLSQKGAKLMLSNSDPKNRNVKDRFFEGAYRPFRIKQVKANRMINCNAEKRGAINELLIMNYKEDPIPKKGEYIESPRHWKDMYTNAAVNGEWKPVDKFPITRINIDKSLLSYPNQIDKHQVRDMLTNFDKKYWIPILVNKNFYLLDGQHRLTVAKKMGLKYIDVIVEDTRLLKHSPKRTKSAIESLPF